MSHSQLSFKGAHQASPFSLSEQGFVRFGQGENCDYELLGQGVDPLHFQIQQKGKHHLLTDLHSQSGTYVNGQRVSTHTLAEGDEISLGSITLVYTSGSSQHPSPTSLARSRPSQTIDSVSLAQTHSPSGNHRKLSSSERILLARPCSNRIDIQGILKKSGTTQTLITNLQKTLDTLYTISNLILGGKSPEELFDRVMQIIDDFLKPERMYLVLWNIQNKDSEPRIVRSKGHKDKAFQANSLPHPAAGPSLSIIKEALLNASALICENATLDPRFIDSSSVHTSGIRSVICVPIHSSDNCFGALYLDQLNSKESFNEYQLELLTVLGKQLGLAYERSSAHKEREKLFYSCVRALVTSIEAKDAYTYGHSERVAAFSITLAKKLGVSGNDLDTVRLGALLHDIGKIGVPEHILTKPARLTKEETEVIRCHPARGSEILRHIKDIPEVLAAVHSHHEMWNGSGYPDQLRGDQIPLTAQIVAIADAFDAMTSNRCYRKNFDVEQAIAEFRRCSGEQFSPLVCTAMEELLRDGSILPCDELFKQGIDISKSVYE